jgi:hypothetical protein
MLACITCSIAVRGRRGLDEADRPLERADGILLHPKVSAVGEEQAARTTPSVGTSVSPLLGLAPRCPGLSRSSSDGRPDGIVRVG